jgi:general secretion pathway protein G
MEFTIFRGTSGLGEKGTIMILRHTEARPAARTRQRLGFTLMEVLVVAAIIVILAGVGGVVYSNYLDKARVDKARIDVKSLADAVEAYKINYGDYPESLAILCERQPDGHAAVLEVGALQDPWGKQYAYEATNRNQLTGKPRISTTAPDGAPIANW